MVGLDAFDQRLIAELQRNGRITVAELAERVGLSTSPCWRRLRALEKAGVISRYTAIIDPRALGLGLDVFVGVGLDLQHAEAFEEGLAHHPEVVECYAMTGEQDYLVHVLCADIAAFDRFLRNVLVHMPGVRQVRSSFALKQVRGATILPQPV